MKTIENISYGNLDSVQKIDLYLPDGEASSMFVYFHGGGLVGGNKNSADVFAPYLTSRGIAIASANYRMYPDAEYPVSKVRLYGVNENGNVVTGVTVNSFDLSILSFNKCSFLVLMIFCF